MTQLTQQHNPQRMPGPLFKTMAFCTVCLYGVVNGTPAMADTTFVCNNKRLITHYLSEGNQNIGNESDTELMVNVDGDFITYDADDVTALNNEGDAPGQGTGSAARLPVDAGNASKPLERPDSQPGPDVIRELSVLLSPVPGQPGFEDEPYTLFADGVVIREDLTGPDGVVKFEQIPGVQSYSVELVSGRRLLIKLKEDGS